MTNKYLISILLLLLCNITIKAQTTLKLTYGEPGLIHDKEWNGTEYPQFSEKHYAIENKEDIDEGDDVAIKIIMKYESKEGDEWIAQSEPHDGYFIRSYTSLIGEDADKYQLDVSQTLKDDFADPINPKTYSIEDNGKKIIILEVPNGTAKISTIHASITAPEDDTKYEYGTSAVGIDIKATVNSNQPGTMTYVNITKNIALWHEYMLEVGKNLIQFFYKFVDDIHYICNPVNRNIIVEPKTIDYEGELIINSKPKDGTTNFIPAQIEKLPTLKGIIDDDDVQLAFDFENNKYPSANPGEYEVTINLILTGTDAANYKLSKHQETRTVKIEQEEKKTAELEGNFAIYPRYFDNTTNVYKGEVTVPSIKNKTEGDDVKIAVDYTQTAFPDAAIGEQLVKIVYYLDGKDAYKYKLAKTSQYEYGEIKAYKIAINQTPDSKGVYQLEYTQSEIGFDLRIDNISNENETAKYFVNGDDVTGKMLTAGAYTIKAVMYQYNLQVAEAEWKVNVKKLKLKITDPQVQHTKVYDGTKSVELIGNQCEITNSLESDNINIASQTQEYDSPEIGTGKKITVSFTISGDLTDKYTAPDNVVYNDGVISPGKIEVSDIKVIKTDYCQGEEAKIVLTISAGVPQTAAITFDNEAKQNGFTDLEINNLTTESETEKSFTLKIPETAGGGTHNGKITLSDPLGTVSQKYSFSITVNYPSNYIVSKFTDVVLVNNYSEQFTDYQWFKNGEKIEGATLQFYCDPNGISGIYSVEAGTAQGSKVKICGAEFTAEEQAVTKSLVKKVEVYPNPATSLHPINVQLVNLSENEIKNANMVIINSIGNKVMQLKDLSEKFEISLPKGSYTITIFFNKQKISTKVIVNN